MKSGSVTLNCVESMKCLGFATGTHLGRHTICLGEIYLRKRLHKDVPFPPSQCCFCIFLPSVLFILRPVRAVQGFLGVFFVSNKTLFLWFSYTFARQQDASTPETVASGVLEECLCYVQARGVCSNGMWSHCRLPARHWHFSVVRVNTDIFWRHKEKTSLFPVGPV